MKRSIKRPWNDVYRPTEMQDCFEDHWHICPERLAENNHEAEERHSVVAVVRLPGIADPRFDHFGVARLHHEEDARVAVEATIQAVFDGSRTQSLAKVG